LRITKACARSPKPSRARSTRSTGFIRSRF